jgi:hypothetical protein
MSRKKFDARYDIVVDVTSLLRSTSSVLQLELLILTPRLPVHVNHANLQTCPGYIMNAISQLTDETPMSGAELPPSPLSICEIFHNFLHRFPPGLFYYSIVVP